MTGNQIDRRKFLKRSALVGAGLALAPTGRVLGANERVNVAIIGMGNLGANHHFKIHQKMPNVEIVAVCDPDTKRMQRAGDAVKQVQDYRHVLDMKDVDAVIVVTPNHWHAPMAVFACQAGKHVHVEKPVSHGIWEGQQMVAAARRYRRVVQSGQEQRSCPAPRQAGADLRAGKYGKVKWVHCMKMNVRKSIGLVHQPQPVPDHIDYNLWAGPAPMTPVMRKQFHYDWHWQWHWGDGEMGNWHVHYIDDLCHMLGWTEAPTRVVTAGGRFVWNDNGQTPNMEFALMEHQGLKVVIEIRNLPYSTERRGAGVYLDRREGNIIVCEDAVVKMARGGGAAFSHDGQKIKTYKGTGGAGHAQNFIDAVRSGNPDDLNAPIETGVLPALISHQANISYRLGAKASVEQIRQRMKDHEDALHTIESIVGQIQANKGDLDKLMLGPVLQFDNARLQFTGVNAAAANAYLRYEMRKEFAVPDKV